MSDGQIQRNKIDGANVFIRCHPCKMDEHFPFNIRWKYHSRYDARFKFERFSQSIYEWQKWCDHVLWNEWLGENFWDRSLLGLLLMMEKTTMEFYTRNSLRYAFKQLNSSIIVNVFKLYGTQVKDLILEYEYVPSS